jgi:hypothetical protein
LPPPGEALGSLGGSNSNRQRLRVLRVVYREQPRVADLGHRIRDRFANARICACCKSDAPAPDVIRLANVPGGCIDSPVKRGRAFRVRQVEIGEFHNDAGEVVAVGSRANCGKARCNSTNYCCSEQAEEARGGIDSVHSSLRND